MINKIFGRWTITSLAEPYISPADNYKHPRYLCTCKCGNTKVVRKSSLEQGDSRSCGCLQKEGASSRLATHALSGHELFSVWFDMNRRCYDTTRKDYKHYGGRGITVCEKWRGEDGLKMFIEQMHPTYIKGLEIDRTDVNGNYTYDNCKWATRREQVINRRQSGSPFDTHYLDFNNQRLCISQWADVTGINKAVIGDRITKLKWSIEKALTTPVKADKIVVVIDKQEFTVKDIFKHPCHLSIQAKKKNLSGFVYCSELFKDIGETKARINKKWVSSSPIVNRNKDIWNFLLTDEMKKRLTKKGIEAKI